MTEEEISIRPISYMTFLNNVSLGFMKAQKKTKRTINFNTHQIRPPYAHEIRRASRGAMSTR